MGNLQVFSRPEFGQVRILTSADGTPQFVANDICLILELGNPRSSLALLDEDEKGVHTMDTLGGKQQVAMVTEPGLYSLILRSRKPEARQFKRWIVHEILPAIRKHGGYLTPAKVEEALLNPDTLIRLAVDLKTERARRQALEAQATADRPKLLFADAVAASATSILIGDLAKLLRQNNVQVGQNRLFHLLRDQGFLMRMGERRNMPSQKGMELGLFEVRERTINNPDGSIRITRTTKVTGKGQIYFINLFTSRRDANEAWPCSAAI